MALVVDAVVGDPPWLWRRMPHPVVWIGQAVKFLDEKLNREDLSPTQRKILGIVTILFVVSLAIVVGWSLEALFLSFAFGWIGIVVIAAILLAGRSLYDHVAAVANAVETGGIDAARSEIAKIVGRDPEQLDESGLSRAAIESAAENFSDGLVAPALWFAVLGLPGLLAYKAINTADSMIGYRSPKYRDFGWAAARLDDVVNWPAARISSLLIGIAAPLGGGSFWKSLQAIRADARKHRSPNAGWPEASMAAALGVSLSGPRIYEGAARNDPYINAEGREPNVLDVRKAIRVYIGAWLNCFLAVALAATFAA